MIAEIIIALNPSTKPFPSWMVIALQERDLSLTEISEQLGIGKGEAHGFLNTLKGRKFVQQNSETKKYGFGVQAFELGKVPLQETFLKSLILPKLKNLAFRWRESINTAILDDDEFLYFVTRESEETRLPATCTAKGEILPTALPDEVLRRMYADRCRFKRQAKNSISSLKQFLKTLAEVRKKNLAYDRVAKNVSLVYAEWPHPSVITKRISWLPSAFQP